MQAILRPAAGLEQALREASGSPISPEVALNDFAAFPKAGPSGPPEQTLTPHELRIVGMLADGDSYQEIGGRLGITVNTVRNYIRSIYWKLRVHTKSEAVSKALRACLIT